MGRKQQPLQGKRIINTRSHEQAASFSEMISKRGAIPVEVPLIRIRSVKVPGDTYRIVATGVRFDWVIFTSANGVRFFQEYLERYQLQFPATNIAAVGRKTKQAIEAAGWKVALLPQEFVAEALADELLHTLLPHERILIIRGNLSRSYLADTLESKGFDVNSLILYETATHSEARESLMEAVKAADVLTFTSSSAIQAFAELGRDRTAAWTDDIIIACIGPIAAKTARDLGIRVDVQAEEYTLAGMLDELEHYFLDC